MRRWSERQAALAWSGLVVATLLAGGVLASSQATAAPLVGPALKTEKPASPAAWIWPDKTPEPCWSPGEPFRNRCSASPSALPLTP